MPHDTVLADGSFDFSGGVDSQALTTIKSALIPNGLDRNQLSWLTNATCRGGGITQRAGWQKVCTITDGTTLFQGGWMYNPTDGVSFPYLIYLIGGRVIQVNPDTGIVTDLSAIYGVTNPPAIPQAYFTQGEEFLIIQAGDGLTKPLFYYPNAVSPLYPIPPPPFSGFDAGPGFHLRRSLGITNPIAPVQVHGVNEIPAATAMDYYMNRIWYAQGRQYSAGDIVQGAAALPPTAGVPGAPSPYDQQLPGPYGGRDAILNVTENPLAFGGDGFSIPTNNGNIRALFHNANLNAPLGQGQLLVGTRKAIYAQQVPITRTDWINANSNNMPIQNVVQLNNGVAAERSVTLSNGDVFFQSLEPAIRSLFASVRNFGQWGNVALSRNEDRILQFNDRNLIHFGSGIQFNNRVLQTALPKQVSCGVVHQSIIPLDFDLISSLQQTAPPAWEGAYSGADFLQLHVGDFGGRERAFGTVVSRVDGSIELWELTQNGKTDDGDNRVVWTIEFPSFNAGKELDLKELMACEIWVDRESGDVEMTLEYRQDADPCWKLWGATQFCVARSCAEDVNNPACYPIGPTYREGYCFPVGFGKPMQDCSQDSCNKSPSDIAYQFQPKLTIKGFCRIRGIILYMAPKEKGLYERMNCIAPAGILTPSL